MEKLTSRKNPKITHMKKLGESRAYRRETGEYISDGRKLLHEAVMHGQEITCVLTASGEPTGLPDGVPVYEVDMSLIEAVSPLKNPQPVIFSCKMKKDSDELRGAVLILENIQDPGNVGAMLRTANAMGIGTVILAGSCADVYNPKTLRASMGAVYRQHFFEASLSDIKKLCDNGLTIYGAALSDKAKLITEVDFNGCAVCIGSEGQGLSEEMLALCRGTVIIPMAGDCESLNAGAAAAIIMWEMGGKCLS